MLKSLIIDEYYSTSSVTVAKFVIAVQTNGNWKSMLPEIRDLCVKASETVSLDFITSNVIASAVAMYYDGTEASVKNNIKDISDICAGVLPNDRGKDISKAVKLMTAILNIHETKNISLSNEEISDVAKTSEEESTGTGRLIALAAARQLLNYLLLVKWDAAMAQRMINLLENIDDETSSMASGFLGSFERKV
jgi:hypothetical protein